MMTLLIALTLLGAFVLLGIGMLPAEASSIGKRLEGLQAAAAGTDVKASLRDAEEMNKSFIVRVMLPLADRFSKIFSTITPVGMMDRARKDIAAAGMIGKVTAVQLTTLSWILMIGLPGIMWMATASKPRSFSEWGFILLALMLGYRLPIGVVKSRAKRRQTAVLRSLPFTLDLICISVEAGVSFDGAIQIVTEKTKGPLTDELALALREVRLGKGRNEALLDIAQRTGVEDLRNFLSAVVYISRLGGSLVNVIRIQADAIRIRRRQRAEEKAMKTPVKIMIPLVLFIFPAMFIVILGPAGIRLMQNMANSVLSP